jgi:hypothetical protein
MNKPITNPILNKEKCECTSENITTWTGKFHTLLRNIGKELNTTALSSYK